MRCQASDYMKLNYFTMADSVVYCLFSSSKLTTFQVCLLSSSMSERYAYYFVWNIHLSNVQAFFNVDDLFALFHKDDNKYMMLANGPQAGDSKWKILKLIMSSTSQRPLHHHQLPLVWIETWQAIILIKLCIHLWVCLGHI